MYSLGIFLLQRLWWVAGKEVRITKVFWEDWIWLRENGKQSVTQDIKHFVTFPICLNYRDEDRRWERNRRWHRNRRVSRDL